MEISLADKIIREAVEEFDKFFINGAITTDEAWYKKASHDFLSTKLRQAIEEVKERLTLDGRGSNSAYALAAQDLENLKKTI